MNTVTYLPLALRDLEELVDYIQIELGNPLAAKEFILGLERLMEMLGSYPYSGKKYETRHPLKKVYRVAPLKTT